MIPNDITITDGVASGTDLTLSKISEQNGESIFTGSYDSGLFARTVRVSVKHTVPLDPAKPSSHLVKMDINRYLEDGTFSKTLTAHAVFRSTTGPNAGQTAATMATLSNLFNHPAFSDEWSKGAF